MKILAAAILICLLFGFVYSQGQPQERQVTFDDLKRMIGEREITIDLQRQVIQDLTKENADLKKALDRK